MLARRIAALGILRTSNWTLIIRESSSKTKPNRSYQELQPFKVPRGPPSVIVEPLKETQADRDKQAINVSVKWRDDRLIKWHESEFAAEPEPVNLLPPVKHEWLARIPVEYHATLAGQFSNDTQWLPIYRLPYLTHIRALIRFKLYLTGLSTLACVSKIYQLMQFNTSSNLGLALLSATSLSGLILAGDFFRRLVCQIYVTEDLNYIRIARFTFFGRRRDLVLPVENVVRLSEVNQTYRLPVLKMHFTPPDNIDLENDNCEFYEQELTMAIWLGGIADRERFRATLGNIFDRVGG